MREADDDDCSRRGIIPDVVVRVWRKNTSSVDIVVGWVLCYGNERLHDVS